MNISLWFLLLSITEPQNTLNRIRNEVLCKKKQKGKTNQNAI